MNKLIKISSIGIGIVFMAICMFYAVYNAYWLPGDDAIVMNSLGWAKPIVPPQVPFELGRFFPLSYSLFDALLLFPHGEQFAPQVIFVWQSIFMLLYAFIIFIFSLQIMQKFEDKWRYPIALLATIFAVSRIYSEMITCYTGVWIVFTLLPVFLWGMWKFIETEKWNWGVLSLLILNYILYCYETVFTIPLTIGLFALIFSYKSLSKSKKIYYSILVCSAVLFLLLYVILVIPRIENAYDGSHGSNDSLLGNALHIFLAQKTMWVVLLFLIFRAYEWKKNKQSLSFFDYLLLASCAYCCGAAVLKLNFIYYYNAAVIVAIPALVYFAIKYLRPLGTIILFSAFAVFYGAKLPAMILSNQEGRSAYRQHIENLAIIVQQGEKLYWYCPQNKGMPDFDFDKRAWKVGYTQSGIAWSLKQFDYKMSVQEKFTGDSGLWFVVDGDTTSFVEVAEYNSILYEADGVKCYRICSVEDK